MARGDDWLADTVVDPLNIDEECIKQAGHLAYWANQELEHIISEDQATIKMNKAEDKVKEAKARANANMRGMDLATLNKLLKTELNRPPDVALWKELVLLHPNVIKAQADYYTAQQAFLDVKHKRLDRKNARRAMEAKAQELNNIIYLQNRMDGVRDSYTVKHKRVRTTTASAHHSKAAEAMASALKKKITQRIK